MNIKKIKIFLGILILVCAGLVMINALVLGIFYFSNSYYQDFKSFSVDLVDRSKSIEEDVNLPAGHYSFWLKLPDREIENKEVKFETSLIDKNSQRSLAVMNEDFSFGYFRNSDGVYQYYKIGDYKTENGFSGNIVSIYLGDWSPGCDSELVARTSHANNFFSLTLLKLFIAFAFVVLFLVVGIRMISKK